MAPVSSAIQIPDGQTGGAGVLASGIVVTPTSGLFTLENGGQAVFYVYLTSRPTNPVRIGLQTSDPTEGVLSVADVTLTPGNWSTPAAVTVSGVDDIYLDGDITYTIVTQPAQSSDPNYAGLNAEDVVLTNLDDDYGPIANDDQSVTNEDTAVVIGILANDINYTAPLTVTITTPPVQGTATLNADNSVTYNPGPNYSGSDDFNYLLCDSTGNCDPAVVTITVSPVNDPPVANDDFAVVVEDSSANLDVLSNDTDVDGDALSILSLTQPSHGVVSATVNNQIIYNPTADFFGNDAFAYTISDSHGGIDTGTVFITVTQVPDPPVAVNDSIITNEGATVNIPVLNNDWDPDTGPVYLSTYQLTSAQGGAVARDVRGTPTDFSDDWLLYTPASNFFGNDSFSYTISDGVFTDSATVAVTVNPSQTLPVANDDAYFIDDNTLLVVPVVDGLLANDVAGQAGPPDPVAISVTNPSNGVLGLMLDGSFTYMPDPGFFGLDTFQYQALEGIYPSNVATVTIEVNQINTRPHATNDSYSIGLGQTLTVAAPGVLENDSDPDNDTLTAILKTLPTRGQVTLHPDGSFVYIPENNGPVGQDSFTYQAFDGMAYSTNAQVRIDLKDTKPPTVTWVSPVQDGGIYTVENEIVTLEASATDNIAIQKVVFFRWDAVKQIYIDIGWVVSPPYTLDFDTSVLNLGWNQIFVRAYDTSGNPSAYPSIFLVKVAQKHLYSTFLPLTSR